MDKINWGERFSAIVEQNKLCLYEICKLCMSLLEENPGTAQEGFEYFLTKISLPRYSPEEIPEELFDVKEDEIDPPTQERIRGMESQIIKELIFQDVSAETFYMEIWKRISDKLLVSDSYQKAFFLYRMWMDPRVPYYQLGLGHVMSKETYGECVKQVMLPYRKMLFAMNAGYPRRTQRISILMQIAEEIPDYEQRLVFWARTFEKLEKQIVGLRQRVQELEDEVRELESILEFDDDMDIE